jgi:hypothetical protein
MGEAMTDAPTLTHRQSRERLRLLSAGLVPADQMTDDEKRAGWATPPKLLAETLDGRPWPPAPSNERSTR